MQNRKLNCLPQSTSAPPPSRSTASADWVDVDEAPPPTTQQLALRTHASTLDLGRKSAKSHRKGDVNKCIGNDARAPWKLVRGLRNYGISVVETIPTAQLMISSTSVPVYAAQSFTLSQVDNVSSYIAVFDQYKITEIEVLIEPSVSEVNSNSADVGSYITAVDIDDDTPPATVAQLGPYTSSLMSKGTASHYHRWKPTIAIAAYSGAFTSYASTDSEWLDCASTGIKHYGLKAAIPIVSALQTYFYTVKLHISFRSIH